MDRLKEEMLQYVEDIKFCIDEAKFVVYEMQIRNLGCADRLASYEDAMNKSISELNKIDELIEKDDYSSIFSVYERVTALSIMIQSDVMDFLTTVDTGFNLHPDEKEWN